MANLELKCSHQFQMPSHSLIPKDSLTLSIHKKKKKKTT
ncbi:unnamed protein product, partial [Vitis vinifera]|uniref:Uncharacterized protein n=1 Tax=Vitis vinifera TaxID=29760 RepID=D7SGW8_VITVI